MTKNPYATIKQNQIMTASPAELTLMLYDGAIKFANQAKIAIEANEVEKAHRLIIRVQNIIAELQVTLDDKYEIAENFANIYEFVIYKLVEANMKKLTEPLDEALLIIRELRNTWKEAMNIAKNAEQQKVAL